MNLSALATRRENLGLDCAMNGKAEKNLIDILEEDVLRQPLTEELVDRLNFDRVSRWSFYEALADGLQNLKLPTKADDEVRPGLLFHRNDSAFMMGAPNPEVQIDRLPYLKRLLLFSDSVLFDIDDLVLRLRIGLNHPDSRIVDPNSLSWTDVFNMDIKTRLKQICRYSVLIKSGVIIPIFTQKHFRWWELAPDAHDVDEYIARIRPSLEKATYLPSGDLTKIVIDILRREMELISSPIKFDHCFETPELAEAYRALLIATRASITAEESYALFHSAYVLSNVTIDPDKVSDEDLIRMRHDEELFADWRRMLTDSLHALYTKRDDYKGIDAQFRQEMIERCREWNEKVKNESRRRSGFGSALDVSTNVAIGMFGGAAMGAFTAGTTDAMLGLPMLASAIAGAGVGRLSEEIFKLYSSFLYRPERRSLANHFMATGVPDALLRKLGR